MKWALNVHLFLCPFERPLDGGELLCRQQVTRDGIEVVEDHHSRLIAALPVVALELQTAIISQHSMERCSMTPEFGPHHAASRTAIVTEAVAEKFTSNVPSE